MGDGRIWMGGWEFWGVLVWDVSDFVGEKYEAEYL